MNISKVRQAVRRDLKSTHKPIHQLAAEIGISRETLAAFLSAGKVTRHAVVVKIAQHYRLEADQTPTKNTPAVTVAGV